MMLSEQKAAMTEKCLNRLVADTIHSEKERNKKKAYIQASKLARLKRLMPVQIPIDFWNALGIVSDVK